jgi:hypothetical protein
MSKLKPIIYGIYSVKSEKLTTFILWEAKHAKSPHRSKPSFAVWSLNFSIPNITWHMAHGILSLSLSLSFSLSLSYDDDNDVAKC